MYAGSIAMSGSALCMILIAFTPYVMFKYCSTEGISIATMIYRFPIAIVGSVFVLYDLLPVSLLRTASATGYQSRYLESIYCVTVTYCVITIMLILGCNIVYKKAKPDGVFIVSGVLCSCIVIAVTLLAYYSINLFEALDPSGFGQLLVAIFK